MVYNVVQKSLCIYACYHLESVPRHWAVGLEGVMCAGVLCSARFSFIAFVYHVCNTGNQTQGPWHTRQGSPQSYLQPFHVSYFLFLTEFN